LPLSLSTDSSISSITPLETIHGEKQLDRSRLRCTVILFTKRESERERERDRKRERDEEREKEREREREKKRKRKRERERERVEVYEEVVGKTTRHHRARLICRFVRLLSLYFCSKMANFEVEPNFSSLLIGLARKFGQQ
jgi:hypothetical protein